MLLDTSVLVDIDRGVEKRKVERLDNEAPHRVSSVTVSEFYAGVHIRDGSGKEKAEKLLGNAIEVGMEGRIARKAGELIARKKKQDLSLNLNDIYIAATALVKGDTVLTRDTEDFEELENLEVRDWQDF